MFAFLKIYQARGSEVAKRIDPPVSGVDRLLIFDYFICTRTYLFSCKVGVERDDSRRDIVVCVSNKEKRGSIRLCVYLCRL